MDLGRKIEILDVDVGHVRRVDQRLAVALAQSDLLQLPIPFETLRRVQALGLQLLALQRLHLLN